MYQQSHVDAQMECRRTSRSNDTKSKHLLRLTPHPKMSIRLEHQRDVEVEIRSFWPNSNRKPAHPDSLQGYMWYIALCKMSIVRDTMRYGSCGSRRDDEE